MKIDRGKGAPTWVALRRDRGVTIHQGASHVMLGPDELADLLDAIHEMTGQSSPPRAEKTNGDKHIR